VKDKVFLFKFLFPKKVLFPIGSQGILVDSFRQSEGGSPEWDRILSSRPLSERSPREQRSRGDSQPSAQQSERLHRPAPDRQSGQPVPNLRLGAKHPGGLDKLEFRLDIGGLQPPRADRAEPRSEDRQELSPGDSSSRDLPGSSSSRRRGHNQRPGPGMGINKISLPKPGMPSGGVGLGLGMPALNLCKIL
jgi:hypothetical protein